jgi:hypothetical protein
MKKYIFIAVTLLVYSTAFCQDAKRDSVLMEYVNTINTNSTDFSLLFNTITKPGTNVDEKITLFYYWVYKNFTFDTDGFIKNIRQQTLQETLISKKGLCYEYNNLLEAACKELNIPNFNIEGYVKFYQFKAGQNFNEANHIWHAVYVDNKWLFIDLLWACGNLYIHNNDYVFKKKINTAYFMAQPQSFITTHLPLDPVWQFESKPVTMAGFISKVDGIDESLTGEYMNYADSIAKMNKLSLQNRQIVSATRAYNFNNANSDILITTYYNIAVDLINKKSPTKTDLLNAKTYFLRSKNLMSKTTNQDVLNLKSNCEQGIKMSDSKLKFAK